GQLSPVSGRMVSQGIRTRRNATAHRVSQQRQSVRRTAPAPEEVMRWQRAPFSSRLKPCAAVVAETCVFLTGVNMSNKGQLLQDPFLNALRKEHVPVSIYLVNGIKLQGQIESFDQYVVLLRNTVTQMVYKHAISTVVPARAVAFNIETEAE